MKVKIYIMHSDKSNYKEDIYKPLLEKGLMEEFYLILPMSQKYMAEYIKELLADSDIVICDLSNHNFFLKMELKMATKLNKKIYYLIKSADKNRSKFTSSDIIAYDNTEQFTSIVTNILNSLDKKEILLNRDNIYSLGKIERNA